MKMPFPHDLRRTRFRQLEVGTRFEFISELLAGNQAQWKIKDSKKTYVLEGQIRPRKVWRNGLVYSLADLPKEEAP